MGTLNSDYAVADLAIFGGTPRFAEPLHVGRPHLGDRGQLLSRIEGALDRHWLTNDGPSVRELEHRIASVLGVEHCVAVCNGTLALALTARALGLRGEVLVPAFTFVATAHALEWIGITPVFCDVDAATLTLDPWDAESRITPRTTGILGVHLFGRGCDARALEELGRRYGLQVFYDASHAFGCSHRGRMIGGFGAAEVFSLHATKFVHTMEGGAITTDDGVLADALRRMRNFGFAGFDDVRSLGINGKMNEVAACVGLNLLDAMRDITAVNREHHASFREAVAGIPGLVLREPAESELANWQYVVIEVDAAHAGLDRDDLVRILHAERVLARRYFHPGCHRMEPYRSRPGGPPALPASERAADRLLSVPTGTGVTRDEIRRMGDLLRFAVAHASDIAPRLAAGLPGGDRR